MEVQSPYSETILGRGRDRGSGHRAAMLEHTLGICESLGEAVGHVGVVRIAGGIVPFRGSGEVLNCPEAATAWDHS